jgi:hypothetical protein
MAAHHCSCLTCWCCCNTLMQVEVETLRYTLTDLQETCSQAETSSSGRPAASIELPTIQPPGMYRGVCVMRNSNRTSSRAYQQSYWLYGLSC